MKKYLGTTVNERLYLSGKYDDFYKSVKNRDIEEVKSILKEVELEEESIVDILKHFELI